MAGYSISNRATVTTKLNQLQTANIAIMSHVPCVCYHQTGSGSRVALLPCLFLNN